MKWSKWLVGVASTLTLLGMSSGVAMAGTMPHSRFAQSRDLVALGDSISYGYDLLGSNGNTRPSPYAFPNLLAKSIGEQVDNLSVPGLTSTGLLDQLSSSQVDAAVAGAKTITIDIGSNDLLSIAVADGLLNTPNPTLTSSERQQFYNAVSTFAYNLSGILLTVHHLAPNANIILYNIYNPFPAQLYPQLNALAAQLITPLNGVISYIAHYDGLPVVNDYMLFNGHQQYLVRPLDVHPTIAGQRVLALLGHAVYIQEQLTRRFG